jgi:hypothetical protein
MKDKRLSRFYGNKTHNYHYEALTFSSPGFPTCDSATEYFVGSFHFTKKLGMLRYSLFSKPKCQQLVVLAYYSTARTVCMTTLLYISLNNNLECSSLVQNDSYQHEFVKSSFQVDCHVRVVYGMMLQSCPNISRLSMLVLQQSRHCHSVAFTGRPNTGCSARLGYSNNTPHFFPHGRPVRGLERD